MQDPQQMQATTPGNPAEQLVAVATIRAITIYREANPPPLFDAGDNTVIIKISPEDRRLDRLQASMEQRLNMNGIAWQTLALIARLGDTFEHPDPVPAVEALGLVMAHAAVIARIGQLAIGPIIDLGVALRRVSAEPMRAAAMVARAILWRTTPASGRDRDKERMQLVEALGYAIAKGIDDVEIGHDVEVRDARELFTRIAGEVQDGKLPRSHAPVAAELPRDNRPRPVDQMRKAEALAQLQAAAEVIDAPINVPVEEIQRRAREETTARHRRPSEATERAADIVAAEVADGAPADAMGAVFARELAHAEQRQTAEDAFMATVAEEGFAAAITKHKAPVDPRSITGLTVPEASAIIRDGAAAAVPERVGDATINGQLYAAPATAEEQRLGVSATTVCPQCAAPMSPQHGDVYVCSNGHEHHAKYLTALQAATLPAPAPTDRPAPVSRSGRHFPPPTKLRKA